MNIVKEIDSILVTSGGYSTTQLRQDVLELLAFFGDTLKVRQQSSRRALSTEALKNRFLIRARELVAYRSIRFHYDTSKCSWQVLNELLRLARSRAIELAVSFHLTGAILAIRFPDRTISHRSFGSEAQLNRTGDFQIKDTVFYVTVSPAPSLFEKCKQNIRNGLRVYILVPDRIVVGTRQNADQTASGRIQVVSLEDFISQNIEEIAEFSSNKLQDGFHHLFEKYNERVDAVENDKSLLLEIPENLRPRRR